MLLWGDDAPKAPFSRGAGPERAISAQPKRSDPEQNRAFVQLIFREAPKNINSPPVLVPEARVFEELLAQQSHSLRRAELRSPPADCFPDPLFSGTARQVADS